MDDSESRQPPAGDLSFLGDLDRGMDGPPEPQPLDPAAVDPVLIRAVPNPTPAVRRRPLLDLFPPPSSTAAPTRERTPSPLPSPPSRVVSTPAVGHAARPIRPVRPTAPPREGVLTYEIFYGLDEKPFSLVPDAKFLYHSSAHDRMAQEILTSIGRRDAFLVLTADAGTGKTTLCRSVLSQIDRHTFTSYVGDPFGRIEDLLKAILVDFGVISRADMGGGRLAEATQAELTFALHEFLLSLVQLKGFAVVFIDNAHVLSAEMLDQVRSVADTDQPLLEFVLVGEPALLSSVGRGEGAPAHRPAPERLRLDPLTEDEVGGYVSHRLNVAGGGHSRVEFDGPALSLVHHVARGLPRLVNLICDRVMALGFEESASVIDARLVEAAARDLDLVSPDKMAVQVAHRLLAAIGLVFLMLVGAAAGAFVFRTQLSQVVTAWAAPPRPPSPPALASPAPIQLPPPPTAPTAPRRR